MKNKTNNYIAKYDEDIQFYTFIINVSEKKKIESDKTEKLQ